MRAPTRREQVFALVFVVSLIWGAWNYRHVFTTNNSAALNTIQPIAAATTSARPTTDDTFPSAQPALAQTSWGSDPFNRPWRYARTEPDRSGVVGR